MLDLETLTNEELLTSLENASYWACEGWGEDLKECERMLPLLRAEILRRMK